MGLVFVTVIWMCASSSKMRENAVYVLRISIFLCSHPHPSQCAFHSCSDWSSHSNHDSNSTSDEILSDLWKRSTGSSCQSTDYSLETSTISYWNRYQSAQHAGRDHPDCVFIFIFIYLSLEAIENTRLLKMYTEIDSRVSQLGYMIKHLAKVRRMDRQAPLRRDDVFNLLAHVWDMKGFSLEMSREALT